MTPRFVANILRSAWLWHLAVLTIAVQLTGSAVCARIRPALRERGLILVGVDVDVDVIGDYTPAGIRKLRKFGGADIAALFWDAVEKKRS